jgi:chromosome segregation ATPase
MKRIFLSALLLILSVNIYSQDSSRIKNLPEDKDTSTKKLKGGALIDTINLKGDSFPQKKASPESSKSQEERLKELENELSAIKVELVNSTDTSLTNSLTMLEKSKNDLKNRLKNSGEKVKIDKWEKDYSTLKSKIENLRFRMH